MWKLGWKVLLRFLWFSCVSSFLGGILTSPGYLIDRIPESTDQWIMVAAKIILGLYLLAVFPIVFYLSAKWTGLLQGMDSERY